MDRKEAIFRIKDHMEYHGIDKYPHLKLKEALDMAIAALDTPNAEKPPCYLPEKDNPYPLCEGRGMKACAHCCLWEDYDQEEDESRVNQPLTMWQLREMDGEPVWVQTPGIPKYGRWVIVAGVNTDDGQRTLYCQGDYTCRNYGRDWIVYRRPLEGEEEA